MADKNQYLKFEAESMLDFLKANLLINGQFTDEAYEGSNISIILETLSALFEVFTYQLNFQASEATFNGVQIYENMLKIVSPFGYKARPTIAPTILGTLSANINFSSIFEQIELFPEETSTLQDLVNQISLTIEQISSPKIISRNLSFANPKVTANYTFTDNVIVYPEFLNPSVDNIYYYLSITSNRNEAIWQYLQYIWGLNITFPYTLNDKIINSLSNISISVLGEIWKEQKGETLDLETLSLTAIDDAPASLKISSSPADNYITAINGQWTATFITDTTLGIPFEQYNLTTLIADSVLVSDNTLYAAVYNPDNIAKDGIEIYKGVTSLRNYTDYDKVFEYFVEPDKTISIKFGNGVFGKQLTENQSITLFYIVNNGENGEITKSAFENIDTELVEKGILTNIEDPNVDLNLLYTLFAQNNIKQSSDSIYSAIIANLVNTTQSTSNATEANTTYLPKMTVYFSPSVSSTKYQGLETVDDIRSLAPYYNRMNDKVITRNDMYTILKKMYTQYIYDVVVMNNYEYMAKFYAWLYKYNKISKDIALEGYRFSDSCDFNNIYCFVKGLTKYPINDFIKKSIIRDLVNKKVLTSEIVMVDSINTNFYPYVGNINDDIDWLLECAKKYRALIKAESTTDKYYKKYKRIIDLFEKDTNGNIIKQITPKLLNYIFSKDCEELKILVQIDRDPNLNENEATIKTNANSAIVNYFKTENRKLGETVKLNEINEDIIKIPGISKVSTIKQKNNAIITNSIPLIDNPLVSTSSFSRELDFGFETATKSAEYIQFTANTSLFSGINDEIKYVWILEDTTTHIKRYIGGFTFNPTKPIESAQEYFDGDVEIDGVTINFNKELEENQIYIDGFEDSLIKNKYKQPNTVSLSFKSINGEGGFIYTKDGNPDNPTKYMFSPGSETFYDFTHTYQLYLYCERKMDNDILKTYSNKVLFSFGTTATVGNNTYPLYFKVNSSIDKFNDLSIILEDNLNKNQTLTSIWSTIDSVSYLSFAKWTASMIDCLDFESIGSGHVSMQDFCFPILYQDVASLIEIKTDESVTTGIEY